jgi:hypothetical protein
MKHYYSTVGPENHIVIFVTGIQATVLILRDVKATTACVCHGVVVYVEYEHPMLL